RRRRRRAHRDATHDLLLPGDAGAGAARPFVPRPTAALSPDRRVEERLCPRRRPPRGAGPEGGRGKEGRSVAVQGPWRNQPAATQGNDDGPGVPVADPNY